MTELLDHAPPFAGRLLRAHLLYLGRPVARDRKPNDPVPQIILRRLGGPVDAVSDHGLWSIHDFAADLTTTETNSWNTFRRLGVLGPPFAPQKPIVFDGKTYYCDGIDVDEFPHEEDYSDTIKRFVGTYRIHFRNVPA